MATILCVDDEPEILEIIQFDLEMHGYTVITASSVDEALSQIRQTEFDMILSDVKMPGRDGKDLARTLRKEGNSLPITFVSGFSDVDNEFLEKYKIKGIISKPYKSAELIEWIENSLQIG